jgi:hypothetical protein
MRSEALDPSAAATRKSWWWESPLFIALALIVAALPLIWPTVPPLVDALGHMGSFRVELDGASSPSLARYFGFHWVPVGNLGVDIFIRLIAPLMGLEAATKLVIATIPPLTVAGFLLVAREIHGRIPPSTYFAVPFAYGQPLLYGFLNFSLAIALAFLAFALWLKLGRLARTRLQALLFIPISLLLYFAHAFGWGVLGLLCLSAEVDRERKLGHGSARIFRGLLTSLAPLATPLLAMVAWRSGLHGPIAWAWFDWQAKMVWVISALRDRWQWLDVASVGVSLLVIVVALRSRESRISPILATGAFLLFVAFLALPTTLFGSAYADMRLIPCIFALLFLAVDWPLASARTSALIAASAIFFALVRIGANLVSFDIAAADQDRQMAAIAQLPTGARVASFVGLPCGGSWELPRNSHLGSLVIIRKGGFSNDQWLIEGQSGLEIRYRDAGEFMADPSQLVLPNGCADGLHRTIDVALSSFPRGAFDFVWIVHGAPYDRRLTNGMTLLWRNGNSVLYRIER